jgi:hypothetical protein
MQTQLKIDDWENRRIARDDEGNLPVQPTLIRIDAELQEQLRQQVKSSPH